MVVSGGTLHRALAAPHPERGVLIWSAVQKLGASAAMGIGVRRGLYARRALAVAGFDFASGLCCLAYAAALGNANGGRGDLLAARDRRTASPAGQRRSLVLAGGGMRVAYQAGVLAALERGGAAIPPRGRVVGRNDEPVHAALRAGQRRDRAALAGAPPARLRGPAAVARLPGHAALAGARRRSGRAGEGVPAPRDRPRCDPPGHRGRRDLQRVQLRHQDGGGRGAPGHRPGPACRRGVPADADAGRGAARHAVHRRGLDPGQQRPGGGGQGKRRDLAGLVHRQHPCLPQRAVPPVRPHDRDGRQRLAAARPWLRRRPLAAAARARCT